jgi:hypothetical protein
VSLCYGSVQGTMSSRIHLSTLCASINDRQRYIHLTASTGAMRSAQLPIIPNIDHGKT